MDTDIERQLIEERRGFLKAMLTLGSGAALAPLQTAEAAINEQPPVFSPTGVHGNSC